MCIRHDWWVLLGGSVAPAIASHPDRLRASQQPWSVSADWSSANPDRPITAPQLRPLHRPVTTPPPSFSHTVSVFSATSCLYPATACSTSQRVRCVCVCVESWYYKHFLCTKCCYFQNWVRSEYRIEAPWRVAQVGRLLIKNRACHAQPVSGGFFLLNLSFYVGRPFQCRLRLCYAAESFFFFRLSPSLLRGSSTALLALPGPLSLFLSLNEWSSDRWSSLVSIFLPSFFFGMKDSSA